MMQTQNNNHVAPHESAALHRKISNHESFRTALVIGGIVVAIIVFIFLIRDTTAVPKVSGWTITSTATPGVTVDAVAHSVRTLFK